MLAGLVTSATDDEIVFATGAAIATIGAGKSSRAMYLYIERRYPSISASCTATTRSSIPLWVGTTALRSVGCFRHRGPFSGTSQR